MSSTIRPRPDPKTDGRGCNAPGRCGLCHAPGSEWHSGGGSARLSHARRPISDGSPRSTTLAGYCVVLRSLTPLGNPVPAVSGRAAALADDEVIEQLDIEQLPGRDDLDGE